MTANNSNTVAYLISLIEGNKARGQIVDERYLAWLKTQNPDMHYLKAQEHWRAINNN